MYDQESTIQDLQARLARCEADAAHTQKIEAALYRVADAASAAGDMQEFYGSIHRIVGDLMDASNFFIATLDEETDILSWPYHVDEADEDIWTPRPRRDFRGITGFVMRTGRSVHTLPDTPMFAANGEVELIGRLPEDGIFVPLKLGTRVLGAIAVQSYTPGMGYTEADVQVLTFVAQHIALALTRARAIDEIRRRKNELAILNSVQQGLASKLDYDAIIQLVGTKVMEIFEADTTYIATFDSATQSFRFPFYLDTDALRRGAVVAQTGAMLPPGAMMPLGAGLTSAVFESRAPILIGTIQEQRKAGGVSAPYRTEAEDRNETYLGVPILLGDSVLGVLSVQRYQQHAYDQRHVALLQTLANSMSVALENARLFDAERRRAAELAAISKVSQALVAEPDLDRLIRLIGEQLLEIFDPDIAYVALVDEQTKMIDFPYKYGDEFPRLQLGEGWTSKIIASGESLLINRDIAGRAAELGAERVGKRAASFLGVPILVGGRAIGVISVQSVRQEDAFNEDDRRLLSTIAADAGAAIHTARLHAETQRRALEMAALAEVGREISSSLDPAVVLERIARRAEQLLAAQTSVVFLREGGDREMRAIAAVGQLADQIKAGCIEMGHGIIGTLAQEARADFVNDTTHDPRAVVIPGTEDVDIDRLMAAPLLKGDEVIGMLAVWRTTEPFREADLDFLVGLARQASIAIQNARLFAEIAAEKQFSETLVRNSPVAIMSIDEQSRVLAWNPGAEKLFGYTAEEAAGRNIDELIAGSDEVRAEALSYSQQASRGERIHAITRRTRKGGSFVDVEISGAPVMLQGGHAGFIGIYHDITELQRARREAVAANEAKSAFLATMSHEIRTPMNAVIGMSGLLMDTELTREQRDYAETIRSSGDALLAIINDILDFSKIEAGKMELEQAPFDLRECVESALDLVAGRAVEKSLDLVYLIDEDVPTGIKGDVTRLRQILLNLLGNAVKFTEHGEVVLTVKRDSQTDHLRFAVRDSGIGIAADRIAGLFESFTQADSSTTRRFGGTGLGLAISRRLVELMDGGLWAESPGAGKGSTFSFTIAYEPAPLLEAKMERDLKGRLPVFQGKRALIVDDNATNRRMLVTHMQKWGMLTQEAQSAAAALARLRSNQGFDVAILDVQMPDMDGVALALELRRIKRRQGLPVILLTSLGRKEVAARGLGLAIFLTKPLKPSALFDALAGIFAGGRPAFQPARMQTSIEPALALRLPLKILLVEDSAVNQKLAIRLLEQMGYRADVASNGLEAVDSVKRQAYDVVLMDIQMPEMDGLDATRAIRALSAIRQPRIVAMTANAMQGDRDVCLAAGMDDYLSKPIRVPELVGSLEAAGRSSSARESRRPSASRARSRTAVGRARPPRRRASQHRKPSGKAGGR